VDATNSGDTEVISRAVYEVFDPDVQLSTPLPVQTTGALAVKEVFSTLLRAYPDLHIEVDDLIEEGDKVVARQTVTGTHLGEYMGLAPTGNAVAYNEVFIFRYVDGHIAETWGVVDVFSQMKQLGLIAA
jgi:predicted ester cyclase